VVTVGNHRPATETTVPPHDHSAKEAKSMSLKETLDSTRAASAARRGPEIRAIMERATTDLRASGILEKAAAVGQTAPSFSAPNHDGRIVASKELLAKGPLVVSFFRGAW
jgi:hypothetical protein